MAQEPKYQINDEVVCILKLVDNSSSVELGYLPVKKFFSKEISTIESMCTDEFVKLSSILSYLEQTNVLFHLDKQFDYCEDLEGTFQERIIGQHAQTIMALKHEISRITDVKNYLKLSLNDSQIKNEIYVVKCAVLQRYKLWIKAYCLYETTKNLDKDDSVLAFSHRRIGWKKRPHKLTKNMSVQVATNFGFGRSSYFFSKITYKDLEVIPFSEWVEYRFAKFHEIIRYTRKYDVQNESWEQAMRFCKEVSNLSLHNEELFVECYIVQECETMVSGLEETLSKSYFVLKDASIGNDRRAVIEYRGEKISGALDFIGKIIEFKEVLSVGNLVSRIEECNKAVHPVLQNELLIIGEELRELNAELDVMKPVYLPLEEEKRGYDDKRRELVKRLMRQHKVKEEELDSQKLSQIFISENSNYEDFVTRFEPVSRAYNVLEQSIAEATKAKDAIASYENKISSYFQNKATDLVATE